MTSLSAVDLTQAQLKNSVLIIAAEESSCKYALKVIKMMKSEYPGLEFWGIGNLEMEKAGFKRLAKAEDLAVMGLVEILKNQKQIRQAFNDVLKNVEDKKPKVALLLDYGGFNLRMAQRLKSLGVKVVYYIPPKVWVWKQNRVYKIKKYVDDVLVVHPFEVDFYKKFGVEAKYVGHPLLEEFENYKKSNFPLAAFKNKLGLDGSLNLGLMPGSRNSEIDRLLNPMLETAEALLQKKPNINISVLVAPGYEIEDFKKRFSRSYNFPIHFIKEDSWRMIDICDAMVTASGTATLQVGLLKKPQIVVYKMNAFTGFLAKTFVTGIQHFGLINLILGRQICQEFFQKTANADNMAPELLRLINNTDNIKDKMLEQYQLLEEQLKGDGAARLVSETVAKYL
jgi:lipid-A-disaccharide synthase